jgi:hypothetical protein
MPSVESCFGCAREFSCNVRTVVLLVSVLAFLCFIMWQSNVKMNITELGLGGFGSRQT